MLQKKREKFRQDNRRQDLERSFQKKRKPNQEIVHDYCYNTDCVLGKGSYCEVFSGWKVDTKKKVAVRVMPSSVRAQTEIEIQRSVNSKYIAKIYEVYEQEGKCYIIMELCDEPLSKRYLTLSRGDAITCFQSIVCGVEELHKNQIIHRDLKLDNILMKKKQIKITDFGFAKRISAGLETDSVKCGTPETMSPELHQCEEKLVYSDKQDVWALGVILHQLFYKVHPYSSKEALLNYQRVDILDPDPTVEDFLEKALQPEAQRMSMKQLFTHPIRKHRNPVTSLLEQLKSSVTSRLGSITQLWFETLKGYFK